MTQKEFSRLIADGAVRKDMRALGELGFSRSLDGYRYEAEGPAEALDPAIFARLEAIGFRAVDVEGGRVMLVLEAEGGA